MDQRIDGAARLLWNYHRMGESPVPSDLIFVLGSHDLRVADHAASLFHRELAPYILFSGGMAHAGDLLETGWEMSEARILAERARTLGVPEERILLEEEARNTGENVRLSEKILKERGIPYDRVLAVQKPYMERRTLATIRVYWPERPLCVSSPPLSFDNYPNAEISREVLINLMVGDLQRIREYPARGYQIPQHIPREVEEAYELLVAEGYDKHLIPLSVS